MVAQGEVDRKIFSSILDPITGNTPLMLAAIDNKVLWLVPFMNVLIYYGKFLNGLIDSLD